MFVFVAFENETHWYSSPSNSCLCGQTVEGQNKATEQQWKTSLAFPNWYTCFFHGHCTLKPAPNVEPAFWQGWRDPCVNVHIHATRIALRLRSKAQAESSIGKQRMRLKMKRWRQRTTGFLWGIKHCFQWPKKIWLQNWELLMKQQR